MNLSAVRAQFPFLAEYTYFNHSAIGPLSISVQAAVNEALTGQTQGSLGSPLWRPRLTPLRNRIARLINAAPSEIALVRNTVEGLSTVASGILWREGDNVVTSDIEFPANVYPWLNLESRYGVKTRLVPARDGKVLPEDLVEACDGRTRVVTVSFVQFSNGYRIDLERLGALCRKRGIYLCVDAIQGLGPLQLDVERSQIDFLACGAHKWLLGPIGIGFFYARQALQAELWPSEIGHLSVLQNEEVYTEYNLTFRPSAEKFEGGIVNYAGAFGFNASLELYHEIGPAVIEQRVLDVTDYLCDSLVRRGYRLRSHRNPSEKSGTVSFASDRHPSKDLVARLIEHRVIVNLREGAVRAAPHFYNTTEEVDRLISILPRG